MHSFYTYRWQNIIVQCRLKKNLFFNCFRVNAHHKVILKQRQFISLIIHVLKNNIQKTGKSSKAIGGVLPSGKKLFSEHKTRAK